MATGKALDGKPYAGNPHVRFDEGEGAPAAKPRRGSLLYLNCKYAVVAFGALMVSSGLCGSFTNNQVGVVSQQVIDSWASGSSWVGNAAPSSAGWDDVAFPRELCGLYQKVCFPNVDNTAFAYGSIDGGASSYLYFPNRSGSSLSVADPSNYQGVWTFAGPAVFEVGGRGVSSPVVQRLSPKGGVRVKTDAGAVGVVSNVVGGGAFSKVGQGGLDVAGTAGAMSSLFVREGDVVVRTEEAAGSATLEAALAKAYLHFDTSQTDTATEEDGRVVQLLDVSGNGRNATTIAKRRDGTTFEFVVPGPRLVRNAQNGLAVLDFGPATEADASSPSDVLTARGSAALSFPRLTRVREVFIVAADSASTAPFMSYSPDTYQFEFQRGDNGEIFAPGYGGVSVSSDYYVGGFVRGGDIRVNGARVTFDFNAAGTEMKVVSYGVLPYPATDGNAAHYAPVAGFCNSRDALFGGLKIGEYIEFAENLTAEERRLICEYLTHKWATADDADYSFDSLAVAGGSSVGAAAGSNVRVRNVKTSGELVKNGEGVLAAASFCSPTGVKVEGGSFGLLPSFKPSASPQVAADALYHFDASDGASVKLDGNGVFERWDDVRGEAFGSAVPVTADMCKYSTRAYGKPAVVEAGLNGKNFISLGARTTGDVDHSASAGLVFEAGTAGQARIRTGFVVGRKRGTDTFLVGGKTTYNFHPSGNYLLHPTYGATALMGGKWTVDGIPQEVAADACLPSDEWKLIAFEATDKVVAETFGADRISSGPNIFGGVDIAEAVFYDRRLSAQERVDTEAHLLGKWLGKAHPVVSGGVTAVEGAPGTRLLSEGDHAVGALLGVDAIEVAGGSLVVSNDCAATTARAILHLDASAPGTVDVEDDATYGKVVREWRDARPGASFKAVPYGAEIGCKPPAWRTDSTAYGLKDGMPVVDCRKVTNNSTLDPLQDSSAFYFVSTADGETKVKFDAVREGVFVMRDHLNGFFAGDWGGTYHFHRGDGNNGSLLQPDKWASESVRSNAIWRADSEVIDACNWRPSSAENASRFFVVGFAITNPASASVTISQLARDRTDANRKGGVEFAEVLLFDEELNDVERKALQAHLMRKWKGAAYPGFGTFASVDVAAGASVDFGAQTLELGRIGGFGTVKSSGGVEGLAELDVAWRGAGDCDYLTVDGPVTLAECGVVRVSLDGCEPPNGETIAVLSASTVVNPAVVAGWTVDVSGIEPRRRRYKLAVVGGDVVVNVVSPGFSMIVR